MNLQEFPSLLWTQLKDAANETEHPWRTPVLGTIERKEGVPALRTIVLRNVDAKRRELIFHTDRRSRKVADITVNPSVSIVFYDPGERTQLIMSGSAIVLTNGSSWEREWERSPAASKRAYLGPQAPGTPTPTRSANLPDAFRDCLPTTTESEPGRIQFAVIVVRVQQMDWLHLERTGNSRAHWAQTDGKWSGEWLAP